MSAVVYNEDLVKTVENKYLAVNVISKRALEINAEGLPLVLSNAADKKQKSVAIATQELIDGKLNYKQDETKGSVSGPQVLFNTDPRGSDDEDEIFSEETVHEGEQDPFEEEELEEGL